MTEQPSLFSDDTEVSVDPADIADVARRIAESAPDDPYASQRQREVDLLELRDEDLAGEQTGFRGRLKLPPSEVGSSQQSPSSRDQEPLTTPNEAKARIAVIRATLKDKQASLPEK